VNKRERVLFVLTAFSVLAWIVVKQMPADFSLGSVVGGGELTSARETFYNYRDLLRDRAPVIFERLNRIVLLFPEEKANQTPETTFRIELDQMMQRELNQQAPIIHRAEQVFFENDAVDYYYIDIRIQLTGTLQQMVDALKEFERQGLMIKSFNLNKGRQRDHDVVGLEATVSRLARMNESVRKMRDYQLRRTRR
jgi:hypothetical protein